MKNLGFFALGIVVALLVSLAFPAAAAGPKTAGSPLAITAAVPATPAAAAVVAAPMPPDHPHIHEALEAMHAAHHHLEQAEPIFQGHREEALKHLDAAIHEAEICQNWR